MGQRHAQYPLLVLVSVLVAASVAIAHEGDAPPVEVGGAIGVNLFYGDFDDARGEGVGVAGFDLFRLNADLDYQNVIGMFEYRWFESYSMLHTAWLGYDWGRSGTLRGGIARVPFGPTTNGVSNSYFLDQHYYVGLPDDMDLGIRWTKAFAKLLLDAGYYPRSEFQTHGDSLESARYGFDVVRWRTDAGGEHGFEERHQFNLRVIYVVAGGAEVGASLQYGLLQGSNVGDDDSGDHYALSGHLKNALGPFTLYSQLTYYVYDITDDMPWGSGDLIPMGAYDEATLTASEGVIPALSVRYDGLDATGVSWLDDVTPYVEWSSIVKPADGFNDSVLVTMGAAWTLYGALYVYSELVFSDGSFFVGSNGDFGANDNNAWEWLLNFNFSYEF